MQALVELPRRSIDLAQFMAASAGDTSDAPGQSPNGGVPELRGKTVLVVEDEYLVGLDMIETLKNWGLDVAGPFQTLAEARASASQARWDFALLDVNLDGTDTLDLARDLLKRGIRVIFVTAYADYDSRFAGDLSKVPRLGKPTPYRTLRRLMIDISGTNNA